MSYRRDFPPLGPGLCTDAGWGCTLRSGQMLLAHALTLRALGRDWRWQGAQAAVAAEAGEASTGDATAALVAEALSLSALTLSGDEATHAALLRLFADAPGAAFGVHALCAAGAPAGVVAGSWLGPHALCGALAAAARAALPRGALLVRVVAAGGGGAPTLYADDVADACFAEAAESAGLTPGPPLPLPLPPAPQPGFAPVLLLVPLVLGLGRTVNPAYIAPLRSALALRWSCGVVGGRPGASLFLTGAAGDAALFLDPHAAVQPAAVVQAGPYAPKTASAAPASPKDPAVAAASAAAVASYHSAALRHAPLANMDPSMALGFYADTADELRQLAAALGELAAASPAAPLLTVAAREARARADHREADEAAATSCDEPLDGGSDDGEECWTVV